ICKEGRSQKIGQEGQREEGSGEKGRSQAGRTQASRGARSGSVGIELGHAQYGSIQPRAVVGAFALLRRGRKPIEGNFFPAHPPQRPQRALVAAFRRYGSSRL